MSSGDVYDPHVSPKAPDVAALRTRAKTILDRQVAAAYARNQGVNLASVLLEARGDVGAHFEHSDKVFAALADAYRAGAFMPATMETESSEMIAGSGDLGRLWSCMSEKLRARVIRDAAKDREAPVPKRGRRADRIAKIVARVDRPLHDAWWTERPDLEDLTAIVVQTDPTLAEVQRGDGDDPWRSLSKAVAAARAHQRAVRQSG